MGNNSTIPGRNFNSAPVLHNTLHPKQISSEISPSKPGNVSSPRTNKRKMSNQGLDDWGNFVDCDEHHEIYDLDNEASPRQPERRALSLPTPAAAPPMYVLESSLETQQLWYETAGQRPRQPDHERRYFEKLWERNFENSAIDYQQTPKSISDNSTPVKQNMSSETKSKKMSSSPNAISALNNQFAVPLEKIPPHEFNCNVLFRGRGPFSKSVSKSFVNNDCTMVTLQVPRFRVVEDLLGHVYAEYLIIVSLGTTGSITLGVWKRHSDFLHLANLIIKLSQQPGENHEFKNTLLSWQCVLQRKQWIRCLDKEYLSLKCFLLERFMHDFLFESSTPDLLHDFLGLE